MYVYTITIHTYIQIQRKIQILQEGRNRKI